MKKFLFNKMICLSLLLLVNIGAQGQTLLHYWTFNNASGTFHNPSIPTLKADYSRIDTNKTGLVYKLTPGAPTNYAGYVDFAAASAADSDIYNLRTINSVATVAGNFYRFRNPADSASLVFYIPSTHYKDLKFSYNVEASSVASGIHYNNFSYSTDSGATWKTTGLDHLQDSTISITGYTGPQCVFKQITVTFTSGDTTVNNNPRLAFRITPSGNTSLTSGNDRFDNFSLDGDTITNTYTTSTVIPVHYWHFNNLVSPYTAGTNPALFVPIKADFSMIDTNKARITYQTQAGTSANYATYYDVNAGDTINARLGQVSTGSALRLRNPSDSMELRIYAPTTAHKNIKLTFETEASSTTNGAKNQLFDYSLDSGATWHSTGMTINSVATTKDSVTAVWAKVVVTFDTTVNNNPRFVARMKFATTVTGTSGNDRIDNITFDGDTLIIATPPVYTTSTVVPVHYWHFNNLVSPYTAGTNPALFVPIKADFSMIDTNKARITYQTQAGTSASYATYYDVNTGDTINARLGQVLAGSALRLRNPSDSMEMRIYAPTTAHKNIKLTFETEASSTTNGAKNQLFDYSLDSGATWHSTGMTINAVAGTKDSVTAVWAKVTVTFDTTVNNNPRFVARMKFATTVTGTSGNDRIDNISFDGDTLIVVTPPPPPNTPALIHYWNFNNLTTAYHNPGIPALKADYSVLDTNITSLNYKLLPGTSSTYPGYIDFYTTALTDLDTNNRTINGVPTPSGNSYRFRNPSDSASLVFYIPSINYKNLVFSYAVMTSSFASGMLKNYYYYSLDSGATWLTSGLSEAFDTTTLTFSLKTIQITDPLAFNNPKLAFKIVPQGNTAGTSGNDRIDNVTLDGIVIDTSFHYHSHVAVPNVVNHATTPVLYPNPAGSNVNINTFAEGDKAIAIYNTTGQRVYSVISSDKIININTAQLIPGIYYVKLRMLDGSFYTMRFIKQ